MSNIVDLSGQHFGFLEVISLTDERKHGKVVWLCKCECEKFCKVTSNNLKNGSTISCGCYNKKNLDRSRIKHGLSKSRIYNIYICIKERCYNPKAKSYENYGGRGIKVCDEWLGKNGFQNFYEWSIANGYDNSLSIDRINVNKNYEPDNCRWATSIEQNNNTRRNNNITFNGETHTISEWSRIKEISRNTLVSRLRNGWSIEDSLNKPVKN